ncbi:unnamed protein product [Alternaria sp. RS040]
MLIFNAILYNAQRIDPQVLDSQLSRESDGILNCLRVQQWQILAIALDTDLQKIYGAPGVQFVLELQVPDIDDDLGVWADRA